MLNILCDVIHYVIDYVFMSDWSGSRTVLKFSDWLQLLQQKSGHILNNILISVLGTVDIL